MKNGLLTITKSDIVRAAVNAVSAAIILSLAGVVQQGGFDVFSADWVAIFKTALNAAFIAFLGTVGAALGTTRRGNFLGAVKTD